MEQPKGSVSSEPFTNKFYYNSTGESPYWVLFRKAEARVCERGGEGGGCSCIPCVCQRGAKGTHPGSSLLALSAEGGPRPFFLH